MSPRFLYLHGFASSPGSRKAIAFERHYAPRGVELDRLDLRVPTFPNLRLSAMIEVTRAAIGGERDRAVVIGSSLGGLTATRTRSADGLGKTRTMAQVRGSRATTPSASAT